MYWQPNLYALVLILSAFVVGAIAVYAWQHRQTPGAKPIVVLLLGAAVWTLGYGIAIGARDLAFRTFWAKVQHVGIAFSSLGLSIFVLEYAGLEKWLTKRNIVLLAVVPMTGMLLAWTNEAHRLIWANIKLEIIDSIAVLNLTYGAYFRFYTVYNYLVLLVSALIFLRAFLHSSHLRRKQSAILLLGTLFPWVTNIIYLAGWSPFPHLDLTPFGYGLSGLVISWGIFRYRLLSIVPIARDKVVEGMSDGVIVLNVQARVVDVNPAAQRLIERSYAQIIGQPVTQVLSAHADLVGRFLNVLEAHTQISVGQADDQRDYDLRISPLYSQRGELTGRLVVLRDITERTQAAKRLKEQNIQLQREIAERQAAEKALLQYTAALEARNAELDAFAHTVAHDLKAPLTTIMGFAEVLHSGLPNLADKEAVFAAQAINRGAARMRDIIDSLLLLSFVHRQRVELEPLDMGQIVEQVLRDLAPEIEATRAHISAPVHWPIALGYWPWIRQVWVNYISNALKYGGNPPRVELGWDEGGRTNALREGGNSFLGPQPSFFTFWVRDNGIGLSPQDQARLFTPFTRIHKDRAEGHGLGLSIARDIVEKLGGQVGVNGQMGRGSTFYFTLQAFTTAQ